MAGEWTIGTLRDALGEKGYIRGPFGSALRRPELKSSGVPVYEQQHAITGTREFRFYIDEEKYRTLKRFTVQPNDLIISCSGTLARVSIIREEDPVGIISQALLILRPDTSVVWPKYLYYFMSSKRGYDSLVGVSTGSVQVNIAGRSIIEQTELPLPPLPEQRAIAHILGTLDDKIELNRRQSETLEAMARALFQSWFVDFEPVRAKMNLPSPRGRGAGGEGIYALFPDRLVESELGPIPEGWEVGNLLSIATLLSGGTPRTTNPEYWTGDILWASAKDVRKANGGFLLDTEKTITEAGVQNSNTKILPAMTTVVTARGTVGNYCLLGKPMAINQTNYGLKSKEGFSDYYVFFTIGELIALLKQQSYGTIFDTITTKNFQDAKIIIPPSKLLGEFECLVQPVMSKKLNLEKESRTLAALRDTLLPKLISGQLRVAQAERFLQEQGL